MPAAPIMHKISGTLGYLSRGSVWCDQLSKNCIKDIMPKRQVYYTARYIIDIRVGSRNI